MTPRTQRVAGLSQTTSTSSTAETIRSTAIRLFYENGYAETSLRQLADEVGLQVSSLYNHMSSKEQLLVEIMKGVMVDLIECSRRSLDGVTDPIERIRAFIRAGIRFHAENQYAALIGNSELRALGSANRRLVVKLRDRYQAILEQLLTDATDAGRIDLRDVKVAAYAAVAILNHVAYWYQPGGRLSIEEVEAMLVEMYTPATAE